MFDKRTLSKEDVRNVAKLLIKINDTTTTLEVKKELRENDYFASQEDVSNYLDQICEEENWKYDFNGTFRVYSEGKSQSIQTKKVNTYIPYCAYVNGTKIESLNPKEIKGIPHYSITSHSGRDIYFSTKYSLTDVLGAYKIIWKLTSLVDVTPYDEYGVEIRLTDSNEDSMDDDDNSFVALSYTKKSGKVITTLDPDNLPNSYWKISSPSSNQTLYFEHSLKKEEARHVYYKITGLKKGSSYKAEYLKK